MMPPPVITLLTDFGLADPFVGIMKGVILGIAPQASIVDLTHQVPPQQVLLGALQLRSAVPCFAAGTVHVAVVDPGVGSGRRGLVVETAQGLLVGPDNGLLSLAATLLGRRRVWMIENERLLRQPVSQTFHGRDVFAPVAAHLARGVAVAEVGRPLDSMIELTLPSPQRTDSEIRGEVIYIDGFGNLVTNIDAAALRGFPAHGLSVSIDSVLLPGLSSSYAAVADQSPVAVIGSWDLLEIAVRNGNAAQRLRARVGSTVAVAWVMRA